MDKHEEELNAFWKLVSLTAFQSSIFLVFVSVSIMLETYLFDTKLQFVIP